MADLEAHVPQEVEEIIVQTLESLAKTPLMQHHEVQIGRKAQLLAAISAESEQRMRGSHIHFRARDGIYGLHQ